MNKLNKSLVGEHIALEYGEFGSPLVVENIFEVVDVNEYGFLLESKGCCSDDLKAIKKYKKFNISSTCLEFGEYYFKPHSNPTPFKVLNKENLELLERWLETYSSDLSKKKLINAIIARRLEQNTNED